MSFRMTSRTVLMAASKPAGVALAHEHRSPYPRAGLPRNRPPGKEAVRPVVAASAHPSAATCPAGPTTYVRPVMERRYELESLRRSLAMLAPGAPALDTREAMKLVRELQDLEHQLRGLREGLQRLLAQSG